MTITIPEQVKDLKIFPLKDYTKIPTVKWSTDEPLSLNNDCVTYAIDTGRSNLVVIDCDNKHEGVNGINNFLDVYSKNSDDGFPDTFTVETPNDGLHFYFTAPLGIKISSSAGTKLGPGIDIRASGGYIVGPNSLIVNDDGQKLKYEVEDENKAIEPLPEWLQVILMEVNSHKKEEKSTKKSNSKRAKEPAPNNHQDELERQYAINWALEKMMTADEGTRNSVLNHTSYFMGKKRVEKDEAKRLVDKAIERGLSLTEAERTFEKAYQEGLDDGQLN